MTDEEIRRAYRRVADPLGTPVKAVFLVLALACIGWYQTRLPASAFRTALHAVTAGAVLFYAGASLRVRRLARVESSRSVRDRFLEKARAASGGAYQLVIQAALWCGIGIWGGWRLLSQGPPYGFGTFLTAIGVLLGARYLLEWLVDLPRLRRDLANLEQEPPPSS